MLAEIGVNPKIHWIVADDLEKDKENKRRFLKWME
jgi:hypothetical protein